MMGFKVWRLIKAYFKPSWTSDQFGQPAKMSGFVLIAIWILRFETGWKLKVNHGFKTDGHSKNSQHYKGTAVDFRFVTNTSYYDQIKRVEEILKAWQLWNFVGLGLYPDWNNPGFHIDARGHKARWGYVSGIMVGYIAARNKAKEKVK